MLGMKVWILWDGNKNRSEPNLQSIISHRLKLLYNFTMFVRRHKADRELSRANFRLFAIDYFQSIKTTFKSVSHIVAGHAFLEKHVNNTHNYVVTQFKQSQMID